MENFRSKLVVIFAYLTIYLLCASNLLANNKRLLFLIDQTSVEAVNGKTAGTTVLGLALHQKSCSILTSPSMLKTFIEIKGSAKSNIFNLIDFSVSDWHIFKLKESNFFFLTPKGDYSLINQKTVAPYGKNLSSYEIVKLDTITNEKKTGDLDVIIPLIKTENLEIFVSSTADPYKDLLTWIQAKRTDHLEFHTKQLESLFYHSADFKRMPQLLNTLPFIQTTHTEKVLQETDESKIDFITSASTPWNVIVFGHGSYAPPSNGHTYSIPIIADLRAINEKLLNQHKKDARENQLTPLLLFFNKVNTHLLAITSCYSGGKNLDYVQFKNGLKEKKMNLHYILAVLSSSDAPTLSPSGWQSLGASVWIDFDRSVNCKRFFDLLDGTEALRPQNPSFPKKPAILHQISTALHQLTLHDKHHYAQNIPQVLTPNFEWFRAWEPAKSWVKGKDLPKVSTMIIGNVAISKSLIDKKPLEAKNKNAILLYKNIIPIAINIEPIIHENSRANNDHYEKFSLIPDRYHAKLKIQKQPINELLKKLQEKLLQELHNNYSLNPITNQTKVTVLDKLSIEHLKATFSNDETSKINILEILIALTLEKLLNQQHFSIMNDEGNISNLKNLLQPSTLLLKDDSLKSTLFKAVFEKITTSNYDPDINKKMISIVLGIKPFSYPTIVSMLPGESIHVFDTIQLTTPDKGLLNNTGILSFLRDAFCNTLERVPQKTFFIKNLIGANDFSSILKAIRTAQNNPTQTPLEQLLAGYEDKQIKLSNVIIETSSQESGYLEIPNTVIKIAFHLDLDNSNWEFTFNEMLTPVFGGFVQKNFPLNEARWNFQQISSIKLAEEVKAMIKAMEEYEKPSIPENLFSKAEREKKLKLIEHAQKTSPSSKSILETGLEELVKKLAHLKRKLFRLSEQLKKLKTGL